MNFGYLTTFQSLDKGLIERLGPTGFTVSIYNTSSSYTKNFSGLIHNTSFIFITFALVFLSFFTLGSLDLLNATNISFSCLLLGYLILNVTKTSMKNI
jgi:hypothetical protein